MVRARSFKLVCIPLLGLLLLFTSGSGLFFNLEFPAQGFSIIFFITTSFLIWQGIITIVSFVRNSKMKKDIPVKLLMISGLSAFYTLVLVTVSGLVWQHYLGIQMDMPVLLRTCLIASGVVVLFSLVYEIL